MKAESPWHMVTRPNDDVSFSMPNNSAIMIDRRDTKTAERKNKQITGFALCKMKQCPKSQEY